jgi:NAD(P)-dependent dehydrogenase (short-subunit alcohol dehydrogenase family)
MYDYAGKRAIVTGAAHGIGCAIASRLASEGCELALWDIDADGVEATAKALREAGHVAHAVACDVGDLESVRQTLAETTQKLGGPVDILINNAGIGQVASILDSSTDDFDMTMRVNVRGAYNCCHLIAPEMVERGGGLIVNIASWFGKSGRPESLAYCTSKFALIGMTQSMAIDLAKYAIRVNAVCPGAIANTKMREYADIQAVAKGLTAAAERAHLIPLGRLGEPDDIAKVVAFLLSDEASYMTGQAINVTGGLWMN